MKIISEERAEETSAKEKSQNRKIVLAGGVFDILHPGHIHFLKESKKLGNSLFILLESDEKVKKMKGSNRPVNTQKNRASILATLPFVDYVINLKGVTNNGKYDKLIVQIKPDVIVLTKGDPGTDLRRKQSEMIGAKLEEVDKVATASTTELIKNNG